MIDRRRFVFGSLAAGFAAACGSHQDAPSPAPAPKPSTPPATKTVLILGGTNFIGPHIVEAMRAHGHTVTLFNRGKTHPGLFPDIEQLHGDRDGHLEALANRKWDAVIDTSGFVPRIVKASAELLAPNVGQYVFISTISVYKNLDKVGADETDPTTPLDEPGSEEPKYYGANKALCEKAVEAAMPGRVATIRPGLIIGPGDPTGRFTHWVSRMADGGEVLGPGDGSTPVQYIDGRDLAAWLAHVVEQRIVGVYNALGPEKRITMKEVLDACNHVGGDKATITWVDAAFLESEGVHGWTELPMWLPNSGDMVGFGTRSNARAVAAGLKFRPILDTARDTLAWLPSVPEAERDKARSTGLTRDKEAKVLAAWKAKKKPG
jgi:2'-hydroxyisoflavone reductase